MKESDQEKQNSYLWPMLRELPYFRALLRAVEADFYADFDLAARVLDLGCGDGQFAATVFKRPIDIGIDPAAASLREAKKYGAYKELIQSLGNRMPLPSGHFASAFSNSVLEHIPDLQAVLNETGRVLTPGALFLFCVPNSRWPGQLSISGFLNKLGLRSLARTYVRFFTRISRHVNMLSSEEWRERLDKAGFDLEDHWHYFPPNSLRVLEWGHYFGLPSLLSRALTGRWVLASSRWNLALTQRLLQAHANRGRDPQGTYTWFVARRR